jgi:hypothetical protein
LAAADRTSLARRVKISLVYCRINRLKAEGVPRFTTHCFVYIFYISSNFHPPFGLYIFVSREGRRYKNVKLQCSIDAITNQTGMLLQTDIKKPPEGGLRSIG